MAEYVYACNHTSHLRRTVAHGMTEIIVIHCPECGEVMHRVPQAFRVIWAGLKPSAGDQSPAVRQHIAMADQKREEYLARKEAQHE